MGWDVTNVGKNISTKKFVEHEYSRIEKYELLAIGQGKNQHGEVPFYLALKNRETGDVSAVVVLSKRRNGSVALKDIDENSGPLVYDCPKSVFKLLSPTSNEFAQGWRSKVEEFHAQPKGDKIQIGDIIQFAHLISFQNGFDGDTFRFEGGSKFRGVVADGIYGAYRITNWRSLQFTKLEKAVA